MHFASMSLGIFDFLIEWLTKFLIWIIEFFIDLLMTLFASLFYSIGAQLLNIVDYIQKIFKKLCGLDTFWVDGVKHEGDDPLLAMITDDTVLQVLLSLTMVAFVMVIVAAIIKIIQSEFSTEGSKNSKGAIFGQALKSIMLFVLVPVCCVGGVILSNALLKMVDMATSLSDGNATIASQIMVSASTEANRIRLGEDVPSVDDVNADFGVKIPAPSGNTKEDAAAAVDNIFRNNIGYEGATGWYYDTWVGGSNLVGKYYSFKDMNFITLIGGALIAAYVMITAAFGMIIRLFKGAMLFMISPPMVALMPLDNGNAFSSWRKSFVGQILAAYGTIVALNLMFIMLPAVNNIDLFDSSEFAAFLNPARSLNNFSHTLFTLTGLIILKDLPSTISNMIGAEDASASGGKVVGQVVGTAAKIGGAVVSGGAAIAGLAAGGAGAIAGVAGKGIAKLAAKGTGKAAKAFGGIGKALQGGGKALKGGGKVLGKTAKGLGSWGVKGLANQGMGTLNSLTGGVIPKELPNAEAREKSREARDARIADGEGTVFDYIGTGLEKGARGSVAVATGLPKGIVKGVGAGIKKTGDEISGGAAPKAARGAGVREAFSVLGSEIGTAYKVRTSQERAGQAVVEDTIKTYQSDAKIVAGAGLSAGMMNVGAMLASGDSLGASDQLAQMIDALQSIAEKTEEQKDLIQKLSNLQTGVHSAASSSDPVGQLQALANSGTFKGIGQMAHSVETQANIVSSTNIQVDNKSEIGPQLQGVAEDMAKKVIADINAGRAASGEAGLTAAEEKELIDKMKRDILAQQKAQLEKALEKKKK